MIKVLPTSQMIVMLRVRLFAKCNDEALTPKYFDLLGLEEATPLVNKFCMDGDIQICA